MVYLTIFNLGLIILEKKNNKEALRALKFFLFSCSAGIIEAVVSTLLDMTINKGNTAEDSRYYICYAIALVCSVIWNFTFNRKFTFKSSSNVPKSMALALLFYVPFAPYTIWLAKVLPGVLNINAKLFGAISLEGLVILAINMAQNMVLEYLWQRFVVFKDSIDTNEVAEKENVKE